MFYSWGGMDLFSQRKKELKVFWDGPLLRFILRQTTLWEFGVSSRAVLVFLDFLKSGGKEHMLPGHDIMHPLV